MVFVSAHAQLSPANLVPWGLHHKLWRKERKEESAQYHISYKTRVRVLLYAVVLHCGTRYLIAVLARPTAQVPRWAGNVSGGPGSIPGRFWRTGVPSFRRCSTEPLHSGSVKYRDVARPLHWPLQYQVRVEGAWKKKKTISSSWKLGLEFHLDKADKRIQNGIAVMHKVGE